MKEFIGTKIIMAIAMSRLEYNKYRNWELPADENGEDEGFLVEYHGDNSNHPDHKGYLSWSPKKQFEESYTPLKTIGVERSSEWPHEQRVIEEADELLEKINKLESFIDSNPIFSNDSQDEKKRKVLQLASMKCYFSVLVERISNFN